MPGAGRLFFLPHGGLEPANPIANSFTEFGKLFWPEYEEGKGENYEQMHWLKQSFEHKRSFPFETSGMSGLLETEGLEMVFSIPIAVPIAVRVGPVVLTTQLPSVLQATEVARDSRMERPSIWATHHIVGEITSHAISDVSSKRKKTVFFLLASLLARAKTLSDIVITSGGPDSSCLQVIYERY